MTTASDRKIADRKMHVRDVALVHLLSSILLSFFLAGATPRWVLGVSVVKTLNKSRYAMLAP